MHLYQIYGWLQGSPGSRAPMKCLEPVLKLLDKEDELLVESERG